MTPMIAPYSLAFAAFGLCLLAWVMAWRWKRAATSLHDVNKTLSDILDRQARTIEEQSDIIQELLRIAAEQARHLDQPSQEAEAVIVRLADRKRQAAR